MFRLANLSKCARKLRYTSNQSYILTESKYKIGTKEFDSLPTHTRPQTALLSIHTRVSLRYIYLAPPTRGEYTLVVRNVRIVLPRPTTPRPAIRWVVRATDSHALAPLACKCRRQTSAAGCLSSRVVVLSTPRLKVKWTSWRLLLLRLSSGIGTNRKNVTEPNPENKEQCANCLGRWRRRDLSVERLPLWPPPRPRPPVVTCIRTIVSLLSGIATRISLGK